jgi:hypothetical protein
MAATVKIGETDKSGLTLERMESLCAEARRAGATGLECFSVSTSFGGTLRSAELTVDVSDRLSPAPPQDTVKELDR